MNQQQPSLIDEIDERLIEAAKKRNPGANPQSQTLTEREKIIIEAIVRHKDVSLTALNSGLSQTQLNSLNWVPFPSDGA